MSRAGCIGRCDSTKPPPLREHVSAALWLNLVMLLSSVSMLAVPVMAPAIAADLGLSPAFLGTYTAAVWAASLFTSASAGHLIGRFGAIRVSQGVLVACAAGLGIAGFGGSVWALIPAALLIGLGHGAEPPASSSVLARITPHNQQTFIFSFKQTGTQIGGMLSGIAFPLALALMGWRGALIAAMAILLAAAAALEGPRRRIERSRAGTGLAAGLSFLQAIRRLLEDGRLLRMSIMSFSFVAIQICLNTFLVAFLVAERGLSIAVAGSILASAQIGGLVGRLAFGLVSGRYIGAMRLLGALGAGMLGCAALLGLYGTVMPVLAIGALVFLFGVTASGWNGVHLAEIARLVPAQDVARVIGATFLLGTCGIILGPLVFSAIASSASFATAYLIASTWALLGMLAVAWPARRRTG